MTTTGSESPPIKAEAITWHEGQVSRDERAKVLKQRGVTLWFTGLSGSGKSTVAYTLEHALVQRGHLAYVLDGDNVRFGLNAGTKILIDKRGYAEATAKRFGLGFSAEDREENIRRIGEVAKLFADTGVITMTSFISPYRKDRDRVRAVHTEGQLPFVEVFISTALDACEQRDPKGLYKQARAGQLKGFTGIDDPYEAPLNPEVTIDTATTSPQQAAVQLIQYLESRGLLK
jgi:adenylylsulfate kinase